MANEPTMKKGILSSKFRKAVGIGLMVLATAGMSTQAQAGGSDTLKSLGNVLMDNVAGQVQNGINNKVNKTSCSAKGGVWEQKESTSSGYGTNGKKYRGGASGAATGKCLTGQQKIRYIQKVMKPQYDSMRETVRMQADANKQICNEYANALGAKSARKSCSSLRSAGSRYAKAAKSGLWNPTQAKQSFAAASRNLQSCYETVDSGMDIAKCNIKFTQSISF